MRQIKEELSEQVRIKFLLGSREAVLTHSEDEARDCHRANKERLSAMEFFAAVRPGLERRLKRALGGRARRALASSEATTIDPEKGRPRPDSDPGEKSKEESDGWAALFQLIEESKMETGIADLAHQHDHYLYGKPKKAE